ncbi:pyrroloquinoline quinone precursor peptide PqqA [Saccharothrix violaceirubra]|uniref:Coenzyme PQQ synthesis protein A n=1 Tax=Saccharothrix violaceirubra TaxID=413306 RepID=A0A7W7T8I1_9PSEU|nr:pyrroloquinoline quinone precursor peptide PqqA [Saccharothrix violaceirubra]MBB4968514.1 coenzyme PQQ precursor peptide PqqA [Saccharothrix violaceirubra]
MSAQEPKTAPAEQRPTWVKPDFRDVDTPMEITAYAARG